MANAGPIHGQTCHPNQGTSFSENIRATPQAMLPSEAGRGVSDERHPKKQTTFSHLPAELRNMIWHAALAPRIVMIHPHDGSTETDSPNQVDWDKIPGMLFANRESRMIAMHHYDQKFILTFTKVGVACRVPVIMSTNDELALSASSLSARFGMRNITNISVAAAHGAPEPCLERISLLSDSLMREGINQEHLTQLVNPTSRAWEFTGNGGTIFPWTSRWRPFGGKQPDPRIFGPHLEDVEDICIQRGLVSGACSLEDWLWMSFNFTFRASMDAMDQGFVDACVSERPLLEVSDPDEE